MISDKERCGFMRRFLAAFAVIFFLFSSLGSAVFAAEPLSVPAKSCILTDLNGTVLYEEMDEMTKDSGNTYIG